MIESILPARKSIWLPGVLIRPLQREDHVLGRHGRAVVEGHAVAEIERVGHPVVGDVPALGEPRLEVGLVRRWPDQILPPGAPHGDRRVVVAGGRVEVLRVVDDREDHVSLRSHRLLGDGFGLLRGRFGRRGGCRLGCGGSGFGLRLSRYGLCLGCFQLRLQFGQFGDDLGVCLPLGRGHFGHGFRQCRLGLGCPSGGRFGRGGGCFGLCLSGRGFSRAGVRGRLVVAAACGDQSQHHGQDDRGRESHLSHRVPPVVWLLCVLSRQRGPSCFLCCRLLAIWGRGGAPGRGRSPVPHQEVEDSGGVVDVGDRDEFVRGVGHVG